jgi:hypothetical protein
MSSGHGPVEERYKEILQDLGRRIDTGLKMRTGKKMGFVLLLFDFGEPKQGRMNYLSNAERGSMLKALQELVAQMEAEGETRQ